MVTRGTLTTAVAGTPVALAPGETAVLTLVVAAEESFVGTVLLETSVDGGQTWQPYARYSGTTGEPLTLTVVGAVPGRNTSEKFALVRVRVEAIGEGSDGITYTLTTLSKPGVEPQRVTTNDEELESCDRTVFETRVQTSGSQGIEQIVIGEGILSGVRPGTRHLITLEKLGHASDVCTLDHGDIVSSTGAALAAATLDAEGAFVLLEFNGAAWQVIYSKDATLTPAE